MSDFNIKTLGFKDGIKDAIPICLGYLSVSFAFGMIAAAKGMPVWAAGLFSVFCLSGTGQFVGINLMGVRAGIIELIMTVAVINARYLLLSITLSQKLPSKTTFWQRLIIAYGNTDEIFAIAVTRTQPLTFSYMCGMIFISLSGWLGGTILGELAKGLIAESILQAMNIALFAMYIALIMPDAKKSVPVTTVVLIGIAFSCALTYLPFTSNLGEGWIIIIAGTAAALIGAAAFPSPLSEFENSTDVTAAEEV